MLQKKSAKNVIVELIGSIKTNLGELIELAETEFICGEKYAYVECLEIIQTWEGAENYGLVGNLEELFSIK